MSLNTNVSLKMLDCKVLNGRKIHIKAMLEVDSKVSSNETVEYVKEVSNLKDIQFLNRDFQINSLVGIGCTKVYAKDTLSIDEADELVEVMKTDIKIVNKDAKISYNKILIKADLQVKIIYLTSDSRINLKEATIPIVGFIDLPNISEEHICDVKYEIKNLIVKPNNVEEHSIYVEAEIEACCEAYENRELQMIQDLYSPTIALNFNQRKVKVMQKRETRSGVCSIRENQDVQEIGSGKIYDVEVIPVIQEQNPLNGRVSYTGEIQLNYIYSPTGQIGVETKQTSIPFSYTLDFDGINESSHIDTIIEITTQDFVVMPNKTVDIKIDLNFTAISGKDASISIIDDIQEDETRKLQCGKYSMVIYFVKPGDTLWNIAKKFGSTVEAIVRVNGIEDVNNLTIGRQLFIPRYHEC